ncbi:hypothetical protein ACI65C_006223 [Semiaphis heraclei]
MTTAAAARAAAAAAAAAADDDDSVRSPCFRRVAHSSQHRRAHTTSTPPLLHRLFGSARAFPVSSRPPVFFSLVVFPSLFSRAPFSVRVPSFVPAPARPACTFRSDF